MNYIKNIADMKRGGSVHALSLSAAKKKDWDSIMEELGKTYEYQFDNIDSLMMTILFADIGLDYEDIILMHRDIECIYFVSKSHFNGIVDTFIANHRNMLINKFAIREVAVSVPSSDYPHSEGISVYCHDIALTLASDMSQDIDHSFVFFIDRICDNIFKELGDEITKTANCLSKRGFAAAPDLNTKIMEHIDMNYRGEDRPKCCTPGLFDTIKRFGFNQNTTN